jgi:N-acetylmuramoyl-L-alanine amidase
LIQAINGGDDSGAVAYGLEEEDVTLPVCLKLEQMLSASGHNVYMTRRSDINTSLPARSNSINYFNPDLAVSIHVDCGGGKRITTYVQEIANDGANRLANYIQNEMVAAFGWNNGGVRAGNFHMNREVDAPSCLIEGGFIDFYAHNQILKTQEGQDKYAKAVYSGIQKYLGVEVELTWEEKAVNEALEAGIITSPHNGKEYASKGFVLRCILNAKIGKKV